MTRKERKNLQDKLYDILNDKYNNYSALVVNNTAVSPLATKVDFCYYNKGIVNLLMDDIIAENKTELYLAFEKWVKANWCNYTFDKISERGQTWIRLWCFACGIGAGVFATLVVLGRI